jgi:glyoxylase-like metal-dependent hydrolase (beta-lactamase superfamily II)
MNTAVRWLFGLLLNGALLGWLTAGRDGGSPATTWYRPELEYFKAVNRAGPPRDPQLLLLLMGQYANANLHRDGIEFFASLVQEFEPRLSDRQKSLYLGAIGLLRAGYANQMPLLKRSGWVRETIEILEEAKRLSGGQVFVVRWMSGVVYTQLPSRFHQREAALADLTWCVEHANQAPHAGWLREVYYQLATLYRLDGQPTRAQEYLRRSGYTDFEKPITLTTPFAEDLVTGHTFSPKRIAEVVTGQVYALSGYEFTEYYFVVSDDGRELIGIDAGTRPDAAQAAYEALRAYAPRLPELTAVLITHAHWDHVGGHQYFRALNPRLKFYARGNYHEELSRELNAPGLFLKHFFGSRFNVEDVQSFKPDITIDRHTEVKIGGMRVEFIPVQGGETQDALFIHLPDHGVMFVGDFIMPYLGAPFVEEGNLQGLLEAIDLVVQKHPRHLLHGHEPLTRLFASPPMLANLKTYLEWLHLEVLTALRRGAERASIQQANLIPPGLPAGDPDAHLPYLVMRESVINRIYDQHVGYWQPDLQGVDYLSRADRGSVLIDYLGVSERRLVKATERMIADGKYEHAATVLEWTKGRFAASTSLTNVERRTYLKLMEKYQEFDPFKFIIYERNRFESSQATRFNRTMGRYVGLLASRRTRSCPARNRQESRRSLSGLFLSERNVRIASAPTRLQRLPSPSIRCCTTEPQADSTTPVPTGKPAAR